MEDSNAIPFNLETEHTRRNTKGVFWPTVFVIVHNGRERLWLVKDNCCTHLKEPLKEEHLKEPVKALVVFLQGRVKQF